jgi:hypothetical protein
MRRENGNVGDGAVADAWGRRWAGASPCGKRGFEGIVGCAEGLLLLMLSLVFGAPTGCCWGEAAAQGVAEGALVLRMLGLAVEVGLELAGLAVLGLAVTAGMNPNDHEPACAQRGWMCVSA